MRRWFFSWGWIAALTVTIFTAYCAFSVAHVRMIRKRELPQYLPADSIMLYSVSFPEIVHLDFEETPEEPPEESPEEPSEEPSEEIPEEPSEYEYSSDFSPFSDDVSDYTSILLEIRDLLEMLIYILVFCLSAAIVYFFIFRPFMRFFQ